MLPEHILEGQVGGSQGHNTAQGSRRELQAVSSRQDQVALAKAGMTSTLSSWPGLLEIVRNNPAGSILRHTCCRFCRKLQKKMCTSMRQTRNLRLRKRKRKDRAVDKTDIGSFSLQNPTANACWGCCLTCSCILQGVL